MDLDDKKKATFTIGKCRRQFNVVPFGLCNAPPILERLKELIFRGLTWQTSILVYLGDIMVVGRTFEKQLNNLSDIFQ